MKRILRAYDFFLGFDEEDEEWTSFDDLMDVNEELALVY